MTESLLQRVRRICASLPDTEESSRLGGEPHFYVRGKIFCGCGQEDGTWCTGMKVGLELQSLLITRPGIRIAKYVGKHGWITVEERALQDDDELERLIRISYDLIAGGGKAAAKAKPAKVKKAKIAKKVGAKKVASAAKRRRARR